MSESYCKLFNSITTSTIWSESAATRVVWVTMLAVASRHGEVMASVPGLARIANVSLQECETALAAFMAPDQYSRTADNEGRRIEPIDGGWRLLNYRKYREKMAEADRREYKTRWQSEDRKKNAGSSDVHKCPQVSTTTDDVDSKSTNGQSGHNAEAEADKRKEISSASPAGEAPNPEPKSDPIPYLLIVSEFNRIMVAVPKVRDITANRKTAIRAAWQGSKSRQSLEFWTALFEEYADDPFLNGTGPYKPPHENWRPDFDHLLKPKVITKVYERAMDRMERAA